MSGIGHNGAPPLVSGSVLQHIEALVDSEYSATEKLVAIKIRLRVDAKTLGGAFPSFATLAKAASVKDPRTVQAAIDNLCESDGMLIRRERPGQSYVFGFSPAQLDAIVGDWAAKMKSKRQQHPLAWNNAEPPASNVGGQLNGPGTSSEGGNVEPPSSDVGGRNLGPPSFHAEKGAEPPSSNVPLSGSTIRKEKRERDADTGHVALNGNVHPPMGPSGKSRSLRATTPAEMAAALNPDAAYALRNVTVKQSGRIVIGEEYRNELRETFTDSQIDRGVERAPSQLGSTRDPLKVMRQIERCASYAKENDEKADRAGVKNKGVF